jgi:hypothetical protein
VLLKQDLKLVIEEPILDQWIDQRQIKQNFNMEKPTIANELLDLVKALSIAVSYDFMSREHGSAIWKKCLKATAYDILPINKEKNVIIKKD